MTRRPAAAPRCSTGSTSGPGAPARRGSGPARRATLPPMRGRPQAHPAGPRACATVGRPAPSRPGRGRGPSPPAGAMAATSARYVTPPPCGRGRSESSIRSTTMSMPNVSRAASTMGLASAHHGTVSGRAGRRPSTRPSSPTSTSVAVRGGTGSTASLGAGRSPRGQAGVPDRCSRYPGRSEVAGSGASRPSPAANAAASSTGPATSAVDRIDGIGVRGNGHDQEDRAQQPAGQLDDPGRRADRPSRGPAGAGRSLPPRGAPPPPSPPRTPHPRAGWPRPPRGADRTGDGHTTLGSWIASRSDPST